MRVATLTLLLVLLAALPSQSYAATGFKTGERVSGLNRICYYNVLGSPYSMTVGAAELCPVTVDAPSPAPTSYGFEQPRPGGRTGFLKGEVARGLNKICYYDVLGSPATFTVSAASICPVTRQF